MSYGLPTGTRIYYGDPGFPDWVYQLGAAFGVEASTYPGHQENDRIEAGYARNPQRLNRGIDWRGSVADMQRFAEYLLSIRRELEQVIWQNPVTGQRVGVAGGKDVTATGYYNTPRNDGTVDYDDHTDHVHTRQSEPIPMPGGAPPSAPKDTLFADVSEWQVPVDDSYPHPVLSIRVSDGTYQDRKFAQNYAWMRAALDSGKLAFGIIYTYVRPGNWQANAATVRQMIDANGGLHPRAALMLDVESGGNPGGDQSGGINALYSDLADYVGSPARIIGYGNVSDLNTMWRTKPPGIRLIVAAYGSNPDYPGKVAHQYTDGQGYGGGLPEGAPPFGRCDMNSADGLDPAAFAAACGITTSTQPTPGGPLMALTDDEQTELLTKVRDIWDQLRGPGGKGWPQLGHNDQGQNLTPVDALAAIIETLPVLPISIAVDEWVAGLAAAFEKIGEIMSGPAGKSGQS